VPQPYHHFIDESVIQRGAAILKAGEAFEVHREAADPGAAAREAGETSGHIAVVPLSRHCHQMRA